MARLPSWGSLQLLRTSWHVDLRGVTDEEADLAGALCALRIVRIALSSGSGGSGMRRRQGTGSYLALHAAFRILVSVHRAVTRNSHQDEPVMAALDASKKPA